MKAYNTNIYELLSNKSYTFFIPPFQRSYAWTKVEVRRYFNDIRNLIESEINNSFDNKKEHFLGTLVLKNDQSINENIRNYIIVDGQQRLTTTLLFIIAARDIIAANNKILNEEITNNLLKSSEKKYDDRVKLKQVTDDWYALAYLITNSNNYQPFKDGLLIRAYKLFVDELKIFMQLYRNIDWNIIDTILNRINIAIIELDNEPYKGEDPQVIFETLNSLGKPLTLADLMRNYVLLEFSAEKQIEIYNEKWYYEIEDKLEEETSNFLRDFLQYKMSKPIKVATLNNTKEIYYEYKYFIFEHYGGDKEKYVDEIVPYAEWYYWILHPQSAITISGDSKNNKIIKVLLHHIFHDIKSEPFKSFTLGLLKRYNDQNDNIMNDELLIDCLKVIRSYLIRRRMVGISAGENSNIPSLCNKIHSINTVNDLCTLLSTMFYAMRFPNNNEVEQKLKNIDFYNDLAKYRKFIFETTENHMRNNEFSNNNPSYSLEKIIPGILNSKWKKTLGENADLLIQNFGNKIGNIVLVENLLTINNNSFENVIVSFRNSRTSFAKKIKTYQEWNQQSIEDYTTYIINNILNTFDIPEEFRNRQPIQPNDQDLISFEIRNVDAYELGAKNRPRNMEIVKNNEENIFDVNTWRMAYLTLIKYLKETYGFMYPDLITMQHNVFNRNDAIISYNQMYNLYYEDNTFDGKYRTIENRSFRRIIGTPNCENVKFFHVNMNTPTCIQRMINLVEYFDNELKVVISL